MREPFKTYVDRVIGNDMVIIACGLPATNKTETLEVIARSKGYTMLRTDIIRKEVLKGEDIFDEKVAADMDKRKRVYETMFAMAEDLAAKGRGVILDATFLTQSLRKRAAEVAARNGKVFVIQQTLCPEDYSLKKISRRTRERYESNALTEQAYRNNKNRFEAVDLTALQEAFPGLKIIHLVIDTGSDSEDQWFVISETVC
ncbi:MAG TPA: ATP-binding protein [Deltaproteobacteria bacterium]|nr:ATP-binding protein [Deltaproteobacteria bacterium]